MPTTAIKHLAKKTHHSIDRVEHLWKKAKDIVTKEYGADHQGYYALVMGITKKMLGLSERLSFGDYLVLKEVDTGKSVLYQSIVKLLNAGKEVRVRINRVGADTSSLKMFFDGSLWTSRALGSSDDIIRFNGTCEVGAGAPRLLSASTALEQHLKHDDADDDYTIKKDSWAGGYLVTNIDKVDEAEDVSVLWLAIMKLTDAGHHIEVNFDNYNRAGTFSTYQGILRSSRHTTTPEFFGVYIDPQRDKHQLNYSYNLTEFFKPEDADDIFKLEKHGDTYRISKMKKVDESATNTVLFTLIHKLLDAGHHVKADFTSGNTADWPFPDNSKRYQGALKVVGNHIALYGTITTGSKLPDTTSGRVVSAINAENADEHFNLEKDGTDYVLRNA